MATAVNRRDVYKRQSWAQVRTLNRPSILTLLDERGQRHRVVLSALDDDYATLEIGDHSQRVPLDELSRDWFGEFTAVSYTHLMRRPPAMPAPASSVRARLARNLGCTPPTNSIA